MTARAKNLRSPKIGTRLPGSALFLPASFDTIIGFFQPEDFRDRAGRADAAFLLERAVHCLSRNAEEQAIFGPHAFVLRRARLADALSPVLFDNCVQVFRHDIPSCPAVPGPIHK